MEEAQEEKRTLDFIFGVRSLCLNTVTLALSVLVVAVFFSGCESIAEK